jgi:hypothetical protein
MVQFMLQRLPWSEGSMQVVLEAYTHKLPCARVLMQYLSTCESCQTHRESSSGPLASDMADQWGDVQVSFQCPHGPSTSLCYVPSPCSPHRNCQASRRGTRTAFVSRLQCWFLHVYMINVVPFNQSLEMSTWTPRDKLNGRREVALQATSM